MINDIPASIITGIVSFIISGGVWQLAKHLHRTKFELSSSGKNSANLNYLSEGLEAAGKANSFWRNEAEHHQKLNQQHQTTINKLEDEARALHREIECLSLRVAELERQLANQHD